ncbi:MAG: hypothetical protein GWN99_12560 [Gemmatimonadetes bacterium]|uniref:PpiC domain-containing protein n=1 Tax=Candidatus Kutchimonas denitrificans TaxID=3056748 RepID=A0AAE4Z8E1_9BACT|nr:hypothetical protein [Gemmatimonadota bacterium]NIR75563.1 hypothetical protein [Candidatus Kutchimonas denitrificans]NIS01877.1 hypothetical protein [Gemmatimonadota bacterium]NIT67658.1 hypothetical protein [Gemmatimonadota bacterium]NIU53532.1 hypothetical protein [Gemmatimonadota bacterium]
MTGRQALRLALIGVSVVGALLSSAGATVAQTQTGLVDRIVAIVGDSVITRTELEEFIFSLEAGQGVDVPPANTPQREAFNRQALERLINETVVLVHAAREDITVGNDEVEQMVEDQLAQIRRRFQTPLQFEQALASRGETPASFRLRLTEQARAQIMKERLMQRRISELQPVPVSEEEIRQVFEAQKPFLGPKPASVTLKQVIIATRPTEEELMTTREEAEQALSRARSGEDFARLAREYSDDAASRPDGGNLGWVQRGDLLPEFEDALWSLRPGQISDIVETSVGFHIIKLERIRGNDRQARHILFRPTITEADRNRARQLADSVAAALRAGANIDSLIRLYGDPSELASLTDRPLDQLPDYFRQAIQGARAGDIVGPIELAAPGTAPKWSVVEIIERSAGGEWTLEDYRDVIRQQVEQQKIVERVVEDLREKTYIEIRLDDDPAN